MPTNVYFKNGTSEEQNLLEDLIIEAIQIYGHDVYYIPRKIIERDRLLNEDLISKFDESYKIEMYVENVDGFGGDGKLLSKFGLEIRDQITFVLSRRRWNTLIGRYGNKPESVRPREGDLVYFTSTKSLFEIRYVSNIEPFLQLNNLPVFKLTCELFEYGGQDMQTGVEKIDSVQNHIPSSWRVRGTYSSLPLRFHPNESLAIVLPSGITGSSVFLSETRRGEDLIFNLGRISYNDSSPRKLQAGSTLVGVSSGAEVTIDEVYDVSDDIDGSVNGDLSAQNTVFAVTADPIISFDEKNPFGDF
jgi:hypothetical protein